MSSPGLEVVTMTLAISFIKIFIKGLLGGEGD